ncbi:MAG: hypothetical protein ABI614_20510 [Planctomycetota bacterium]
MTPDGNRLQHELSRRRLLQLGIDHRRELYDRFARPHRIIPTGDVVRDLLI